MVDLAAVLQERTAGAAARAPSGSEATCPGSPTGHSDISPRGYGAAQARGEMGSSSTHWGADSNHEGECHSPAQRTNQSVTLTILLERLGHHVLLLWDSSAVFHKTTCTMWPSSDTPGLTTPVGSPVQDSEHLLLLKKKNCSECLWQFRV